MSIGDEVRRKKEQMEAEARAKEESELLETRMKDASFVNGWVESASLSPILMEPPKKLRALIDEAMPSMVFIRPKIVRKMPDGTFRCRHAKSGETPDMYSLDLNIGYFDNIQSEFQVTSIYIWIFEHGMVAFSASTLEKGWDLDMSIDGIYSYRWHISYGTDEIRRKLVDTIVYDSAEKEERAKKEQEKQSREEPPRQSKAQNQPKSGGCYIATAVYGSYNCPEVWTLRRYRDSALLPTPSGRLFVRAYYTVSPALVKWFGKTRWFRQFWKRILDRTVDQLHERGVSGEPYDD